MDSLDELWEKPSGIIHITATHYITNVVLLPIVNKFMSQYPELGIEISGDQKFSNIVEDGYDAGIRLYEQIEKDMIAFRISPDLEMMVVGSLVYFKNYNKPRNPI